MIAISAQRLSPDGPSPALVQEVVRAFEAGLPRLNRLQRYYETRHDILARTRLNGLPNTRLPHAYPRYIAQVSASYLLGEPVTSFFWIGFWLIAAGVVMVLRGGNTTAAEKLARAR